MRKAGELLYWFMNDPVGEEVGEGLAGGLLAGGAMLGSDQPWQQTALQTAAAIGGGIALGMGGRRMGAWLGKRARPTPLADQYGPLATMARVGGSETTVGGLSSQGVMAKELMQEHLTQGTVDKLLQEAAADPAAFGARYGLDAKAFEQGAKASLPLRTAAAVARTLQDMDPADRQAYLKRALQSNSALNNALEANRVIGEQTAQTMDENIRIAAEELRKAGGMKGIFSAVEKMDLDDMDAAARAQFNGMMGVIQEATKGITPESLLALLNPAPPVTGEHVGRLVGRILGDEVGVIGGMAAGNLLAQQMGLTAKPKEPDPLPMS